MTPAKVALVLLLTVLLCVPARASDVIVPEASNEVSPLYMFGSSRNETPRQARARIQEIRDQQTVSNFLEPKRAVELERLMTVAQLRLEIAEKRAERDRLRKTRKTKRQADQLDREIAALKARLAQMQPDAPRKGFWASLMNPDGED